jgi:hypothetical protein
VAGDRGDAEQGWWVLTSSAGDDGRLWRTATHSVTRKSIVSVVITPRATYLRTPTMVADTDGTETEGIEERLQQLGRYSRFVRAGLGVILAAFVLSAVALLPGNTDSLASVVDVLLTPLIFVGMGLLLFGIGMHLHLMHMNLVRQLRKESETDGASADDSSES